MNLSNEQIEEIVNWTLPGLTMYYRDSDLPNEIISKYLIGKVFRSQTFVDVSSFAGKLTKNCRFIFASSKAAPLYKINSETEKWGLHTMNANSYFKILDIYQREGKTQIFVLHIPASSIDFFNHSVLFVSENSFEQSIIEKARMSFEQKMQGQIIPELEEREWINRTYFPIGLNNDNNFFSIYPSQKLFGEALQISDAIREMTNDTILNIPMIKE